MNELMKVIKDRRSVRVAFDVNHSISKDNIEMILEAARWTPTPHNMQNFGIVVVDDPIVLKRLGDIESSVTETFLRENLEQLSFSEEELRRKKVGILGTMFPPSFRDPKKFGEVANNAPPQSLSYAINGSSALLIVIYDSRKRAPDSEGDVLGLVSLGCVMENMWLMATTLGISVRILSDFGDKLVDVQVKKVLDIPDHMNVVYGLRLGYPVTETYEGVRVRRELRTLPITTGMETRGLNESTSMRCTS